ncbi:hypothetical protein LJC48_00290 [Desulfovibrio sp. OttesenSCG-928-C06]|nr:hypothetical protein [Desulfovibrio sp. OttesenSCG-928-C06]
MAYDLRLVKLGTGEMVIGKYDADKNVLKDVAILQMIPTQQNMQMMLLPYGYPFDQEFDGEISYSHVMYTYKKYPEELNTKYMEAISNLTLSTGGLGGMDLKNPQGGAGMSGLIRGK